MLNGTKSCHPTLGNITLHFFIPLIFVLRLHKTWPGLWMNAFKINKTCPRATVKYAAYHLLQFFMFTPKIMEQYSD